MKKLVWFMAGIALGAIAARQIEENPAARKAFEEAKATVQEFRDAVLEGFEEGESPSSKPKPTAKKSGPKSKPSGN
jgi:hypothetical protein